MIAQDFCLTSAGGFFLTGLLTGAWKYIGITRSPDGKAHPYVDLAHRASLLYAFACGLLATFCAHSAFSNGVNLAATILLVTYFAVSILGYLVHAALRDTENQLQRPHRLGSKTIPAAAMMVFMVSLIVAELSAFGVVFTGWATRPASTAVAAGATSFTASLVSRADRPGRGSAWLRPPDRVAGIQRRRVRSRRAESLYCLQQ